VLWWEPVTGATSYNVKRSAASGGPYATIATGVGDRFYSVPDLTPGWFVVSAVNDVGEGLDSVEARGDVHYVGAPCTPTPTPRPCPAAWNPSVLYPSSSRVGHQGYEWQGSGNPGDEPGVVPTWSIVRPCGYPPTGVPPAPHSISGGDAVMGCNFRPCIIGWTRVPGSSAYNVKRPVSPTGVGETLATTPHTAYALLPGSPGVAVTAVVNGVEGLRTEQASCRILVSDCISCSFYPTWSVSQSYAAGTTVAYGRYFWRSTRATVGEEPGTTTAWQVQMRCS
jgi:chitodextrinase